MANAEAASCETPATTSNSKPRPSMPPLPSLPPLSPSTYPKPARYLHVRSASRISARSDRRLLETRDNADNAVCAAVAALVLALQRENASRRVVLAAEERWAKAAARRVELAAVWARHADSEFRKSLRFDLRELGRREGRGGVGGLWCRAHEHCELCVRVSLACVSKRRSKFMVHDPKCCAEAKLP